MDVLTRKLDKVIIAFGTIEERDTRYQVTNDLRGTYGVAKKDPIAHILTLNVVDATFPDGVTATEIKLSPKSYKYDEITNTVSVNTDYIPQVSVDAEIKDIKDWKAILTAWHDEVEAWKSVAQAKIIELEERINTLEGN